METNLTTIKHLLSSKGHKCDSSRLNNCVSLNKHTVPCVENALIDGRLRSDLELLMGATNNPYVEQLVRNGYFRIIPNQSNNGDLFDPSGTRGRSLSDLFRDVQTGLSELQRQYEKENPSPAPAPAPEPPQESAEN